jgi:two-component system sensor histidine kinase LytS
MASTELLWEMIERMSVAVTLAFILSQTGLFRRIVHQQGRPQERVLLAVVFGLIGIMGTYAGIPINDALSNSRVVGVMAAGLLGGRMMGITAGVIAGGHRYWLGGFTAFSCALANICEGLLAGWIFERYPGKPIPWWVALGAGVIGEAMQMVIILVTARPYEMALALVREIALPMIVSNSLGLAVFMLIIKTAMDVQEKVGAEQSRKALDIATKTLPYLRRGLNQQSAQETAQIIFLAGGYDAVAITNTEQVVAFVGAEAAHHKPGIAGLTAVTRQVLGTGTMAIAHNPDEIGCACNGCLLASAMVVPLKQANSTIGTLKLYYTRVNAVSQGDRMFAAGLAHLFSTQLELTEIDRQAKLAARSELKALHAQINPHFLFNTLNTITSLVRTKPDLARELLLKLGAIFRYTLHKTGRNIPIAEELEQVRAYLAIEQARHGEKLAIREDIAAEVEQYLIPSVTIQPLVENAIKHGLRPQEDGGYIMIKARAEEQDIVISIIDNGVGMDLQHSHPLLAPVSGCIGLINVHERLGGQYGAGYGLVIDSMPGCGCTVTVRLPKRLREEE